MVRKRIAMAVVFLLQGIAPSTVAAQADTAAVAQRGLMITSMGQPSRWDFYAAGEVGLAPVTDRRFLGRLSLGVQRALLNPVANAIAVNGEYYVALSGEAEGEVGIRLGAESPVLRLGGGWQYDFRRSEGRGYVQFHHPIRRGGIFTPGGQLRLTWMPGPRSEFVAGATIPLGRPFAGKTRPRSDRASVALPVADEPGRLPDPTAASRAALEEVAMQAHLVRRFVSPFLAQNAWGRTTAEQRFAEDISRLAQEMQASRTPSEPAPIAAVRRYHAAIENAFRVADAGLDPATVAAVARASMLEELILPFNRMLGQRREASVLPELEARARVAFARDLVLRAGFDQASVAQVEAVFAGMLDVIRAEADAMRLEWGDDRYVFLPLQLALLPEDHDTQAEIDALVERAVGRPFTDGNDAWYVVSEQFQTELLNMINNTRLYHVLWIHDFRGYDDQGDPDEDSFRISVRGYLNAIAERLERYDQEGLLPIYMIILDQWYYGLNKAPLWLDLLENPLDHEMELPAGFEAWEEEIRAAQDRIRRAIANSPLLQAEIREYGEDWLYNRVKVQINITNPADATFWSDDLFPLFGLTDALMRDHRKIAFYDVVPGEPTRGMALYTGMGVGEHYTGPTWDDRALRMQGPVLEGLRVEARNLLLQQGFEPDQLPYPLRDPDPTTLEARNLAARNTPPAGPYRALQVHNWIGYGRKDASVMKATLYCLMPGGAIAKAPDSLWNMSLWGSLLLGHALRGGRVTIVAPTIDSAPASSPPSLSLAEELLGRLLASKMVLADELAASGGSLHIGLYNPRQGVGDIPGKVRQTVETMRAQPWLAEMHGFDAADLDAIQAVADSMTRSGFEAQYLAGEALDNPKLHMKAHYFATREAWDPLIRQPAFRAFFEEYVRQRALQVAAPEDQRSLTALTDNMEPVANRLYAEYRSAAGSDIERAALYLLVGSQNQNYRSMASDGETLVAIAGTGAAIGMADFILVLGLSTWIEDIDTLHTYLPAAGGMLRRISQWARFAM